MKTLFATIGLVLLMQNAWAIDIKEAKAQGLVGEANTGYIAAVQNPANAEVKALIADVNGKRKSKFQNTAKKNDVSVSAVASRFYELAIEKTARGNYYQDAGGSWRKK